MATKLVRAVLLTIRSVSVFSVLRIVAVFQIVELNFTQTVVMDTIWGAMEILIGVITACLPLLQPPLEKTMGRDSLLRSLLRTNGSKSSKVGSERLPDLPDDSTHVAPKTSRDDRSLNGSEEHFNMVDLRDRENYNHPTDHRNVPV